MDNNALEREAFERARDAMMRAVEQAGLGQARLGSLNAVEAGCLVRAALSGWICARTTQHAALAFYGPDRLIDTLQLEPEPQRLADLEACFTEIIDYAGSAGVDVDALREIWPDRQQAFENVIPLLAIGWRLAEAVRHRRRQQLGPCGQMPAPLTKDAPNQRDVEVAEWDAAVAVETVNKERVA